MNKLKVLLGSSVASLALVAGVALPASAQVTQTCEQGFVLVGAVCLQSNTEVTEDSPTNNGGTQANNGGTAVTVSGDCSAAFVGDNSNTGVNIGGALLGSNEQSNVQNSGNSFDADCSTTNVTNVTEAAAVVEEEEVVAQVTSAPQGGVHAGSGSTATESSSSVALVGLTGSLSVLGLGLRFLKGEL